ncbi:MAG TPA: metalloregulator ArsR/SmtB family transcription factor [Deltaproteobacteria bacterium]|nr:metalloregulator ArsR/SmtB family transcription factor [Deltaproteobacteria bacterium]
MNTGRHDGKNKIVRDDAAQYKASIFKALAHPDRIRIFEALAEGEKTVGEIVDMLGAKPAMTSRHLAVLRNAGLVSARKDGLNVYYANKMPCMLNMLACVDQAVCELADEHMRVAACCGTVRR